MFLALSRAPATVENDVSAKLERFVVLLYDRSSGDIHADQCRKHLFSSKGKLLEVSPPIKGLLEQHIKKAAYQAGHIWGQSFIRVPEVVSPDDWGWEKDPNDKWTPLWTRLPEISQSCQELLYADARRAANRIAIATKWDLNALDLITVVVNAGGIYFENELFRITVCKREL